MLPLAPAERWIASLSLSSGAHSRDPLARNDDFGQLCCFPTSMPGEIQMHYRNLGRSGLKISPICLGTMMFGGPADEAASIRIVAKAREAGINFIDTADAYNSGHSEEVVGRAISNSRQSWVVATKLANPMGD